MWGNRGVFQALLEELLDAHVLLCVLLHDLRHRHLEVLLRHVHSPLTEGVHAWKSNLKRAPRSNFFWTECVSTSWSKTCFSASSLHFSARAPSHLLRDLSQVNSSEEKFRFEVQSECSCENAPAVKSDLVKFIFLEWILRMSRRASSFGGGNSIFLNKEQLK